MNKRYLAYLVLLHRWHTYDHFSIFIILIFLLIFISTHPIVLLFNYILCFVADSLSYLFYLSITRSFFQQFSFSAGACMHFFSLENVNNTSLIDRAKNILCASIIELNYHKNTIQEAKNKCANTSINRWAQKKEYKVNSFFSGFCFFPVVTFVVKNILFSIGFNNKNKLNGV